MSPAPTLGTPGMTSARVFRSMTSFDQFLFAFTIASYITLVATSFALIVILVLVEFLPAFL